MVCRAIRICAGYTRTTGLAHQIVAGTPPTHGAVHQKFGVVRFAPGVGHPDHQVGTFGTERMAQVLIQVALQRHVSGLSALALVGPRVKGLPEKVCSEALHECAVRNGNGFRDRPAKHFCVIGHWGCSMRVVMGKLYPRLGGRTSPKPIFCLEAVQIALRVAFQ